MDSGVLHDFIAGWVGGCAGIIVGHPFDTTKVQMQTHLGRKAFTSTWDAVKNIRTHGMAHGFFRGMALPLASYGLINSVFFGVYGNTYKLLTGRSTTNGNADRRHYWTVFLSGCVGGAAQLVVACPTEVVKVILQSQIDPKSGKAFFRGPIHCLQYLVRERGLAGLYKGAQTQALRDLPASGSYFLTYELLKNTLEHQHRGVKMMVEFVCGGTAGVLSWMLIMPFDVVKSRLQADVSGARYSGLVQCFRHVVATEGYSALFTGARVTAIRAFPVNAITLLVYSEVMMVLGEDTVVSGP